MKPLVPKYATMHSVLSAWARCGQVNIKTPQHRGNRASLLAYDYTLAAHAHKLSERVFNGAISADDIVDFHSHVPMYASFMTALQAFGWRERLTSGAPGRDTIAMGLRHMGAIEAETLRKCPTCVREDQAQFGCGHWRIFHQWPVARHCVIHGDELATYCAECKTPLGRGNNPSLADDACVNCGGYSCAADRCNPAASYWPLLRLMYRALEGNAPELSALVRAHPLLRTHPSSWGSPKASQAERMHLESLLALWHVQSVAELGALMGANLGWSGEATHAQAQRICPPIMQAAVAAAEQHDLGELKWLSG